MWVKENGLSKHFILPDKFGVSHFTWRISGYRNYSYFILSNYRKTMGLGRLT